MRDGRMARVRVSMLGVLFAAIVTTTAAEGPFRVALPGYRFEFPRDHFAHPEFQTEWWYYTGNLRAGDGRRFGFELTFFRQTPDRPSSAPARSGEPRPSGSSADPSSSAAASVWDIGDVFLAHFALTDIDGGKFHHDERVNRAGPGLAGVDARSGEIWNGNWKTRIDGARHSLEALTDRFRITLDLESRKPPVIQGVNGVSQKAEGVGQASHYVSLTCLVGKGTVEIEGARFQVEGSAWMDHEFFTNQLGRDQHGWDWLGLQLDDGSELMVYRMRRGDGKKDPFSAGTLVDPGGRSSHLAAADFEMMPVAETWTSKSSGATYPIAWRVTVPARGLELDIRTPLASQELTGRSGFTPTYWEGAVVATGTRAGARVGGVGYLEMTGYDKAVVLGGK